MNGGHLTDGALLDLVAERLGLSPKTERCDRDLVVAVARQLIADPSATANAVVAQVEGRRQDVLRVVRELREPGGLVPGPRNQPVAAGAALTTQPGHTQTRSRSDELRR